MNDYLKRIFANQTQAFRKLLSSRNGEGHSIISLAYNLRKMTQINDILKSMEFYFNKDEIKELFIKRNTHQRLVKSEFPGFKSSCKFKPELPDKLEDYELQIQAIGINKIFENWLQNSPEQIDKFTSILDFTAIEELLKNLNAESFQKARLVIDSFGVDQFTKLSPEDLQKFFTLLTKIDLNGILSQINEETIENVMSWMNKLGGLDGLINYLTPETINTVLG